MNLYLRLIWLTIMRVLTIRMRQAVSILDEYSLKFRVLPFDCDINLHLTNARYLSFGDLARIDMMFKAKIMKVFLRRGWLPVVNAQSVVYAKPVKPFSTIEFRSKLLGWDEKYLYFEHQCFSGDALCTILLVRGVFLRGRRVIAPKELLNEIGADIESPELMPKVQKWRELLNEKKLESQREAV